MKGKKTPNLFNSNKRSEIFVKITGTERQKSPSYHCPTLHVWLVDSYSSNECLNFAPPRKINFLL